MRRRTVRGRPWSRTSAGGWTRRSSWGPSMTPAVIPGSRAWPTTGLTRSPHGFIPTQDQGLQAPVFGVEKDLDPVGYSGIARPQVPVSSDQSRLWSLHDLHHLVVSLHPIVETGKWIEQQVEPGDHESVIERMGRELTQRLIRLAVPATVRIDPDRMPTIDRLVDVEANQRTGSIDLLKGESASKASGIRRRFVRPDVDEVPANRFGRL